MQVRPWLHTKKTHSKLPSDGYTSRYLNSQISVALIAGDLRLAACVIKDVLKEWRSQIRKSGVM